MCKVIISSPEKKAGFIIFNHLYARTSENFTLQDLLQELVNYGLRMSEKELQKEIDLLVEDGAVSRRVGHYKRIAML